MRCLVTAIGSMAAEAVIQGVRRQPGAEVIGCNMFPREWTAASRLIEKFYVVPSSRDESTYLSRLFEICENERISHLVPLTDIEVDVLSANRGRFHEMGVKLCVSSHSTICAARDKLAIYRYFSNNYCIRPIPTADLQSERVFDFSYPMLAKPRRGRSSEKQVSIPDAKALQFWRTQLVQEDYVVQPFLAGTVFTVDVVRQLDGQKSVAMTRQELVRTVNGAGMTVNIRPRHACDALALKVADILGVCGCVNMEFMCVNGTPMLMDVNPRFSAGVVFSVMAGYDMVVNHIRCFDGVQIDPCFLPEAKIFTRGFVEYLL